MKAPYLGRTFVLQICIKKAAFNANADQLREI